MKLRGRVLRGGVHPGGFVRRGVQQFGGLGYLVGLKHSSHDLHCHQSLQLACEGGLPQIAKGRRERCTLLGVVC